MSSYDVVIIGAGPAGLAAALSLRHSDLKVALLEKTTFPRDKICGDGLCDRAVNTLKVLSEDYYNELVRHSNISQKCSAKLVYKRKTISIAINALGYTIPRYDFDNFLMTKVKTDAPNIDVYESCQVIDVVKSDTDITVISNHEKFVAPIIIIANGALSKLAEKLTNQKSEKSKQLVGIRTYYSGVKDIDTEIIEFHFKKEFFPGYLWIFPLKNGLCNVGIGYHMDNKPRTNTVPKQILNEWILSDRKLKNRFANAKQSTKLSGTYIPACKLNFNIAGNNFMLCGDAANLADPITGGGIGNGLLSGHFAALQAIECFKHNDFSSKQTQYYTKKVKNRIEKEIVGRLKMKHSMTKFPILIDVFFMLGQLITLKSTFLKLFNGNTKSS